MNQPATPTHRNRPPLTDSPWFWVYVFCTAALVALVLAGPKYVHRQPQIERQFAARQSGGQARSGEAGPVEPSTADNMIIRLRPLYYILAVLVAVGWFSLWYRRFRVPPGRPPESSESS